MHRKKILRESRRAKFIDNQERAHRIVDDLPEDASWEDLIYRIYVRQSIEAGLADADADRVVNVDEVRRSFGLPE